MHHLASNLCVACPRPVYHVTAHLSINSRLCDHQCKDKGLVTQTPCHTIQLHIGLA